MSFKKIFVTTLVFTNVTFANIEKGIENKLPPMNKGDWSLIVLPDTQIYSRSRRHVEMLKWTMDWVHENRAERNIQAVLQVGDIVDNNLGFQWRNIDYALSALKGEIPYFFAQGNHDVGKLGLSLTRDTGYNEHFNPHKSSVNSKFFGGNFEPGRYENAYYYLNVGKNKYLVLLLEFAPRDEALEWANEVVARHPNHKVMLVLHEYMDEASRLLAGDGIGRRTFPKTMGNAHRYVVRPAKGFRGQRVSKNCGEEIWDKLVSKHPNFEFVFSGHHSDYVDAMGAALKTGHGAAKAFREDDLRFGKRIHRVHQFMFDSQWIRNGGDAWMIVVQFDANGENARAQMYSPLAEFYPQRLSAPDIIADAWNLIRNPDKIFRLLDMTDFLYKHLSL